MQLGTRWRVGSTAPSSLPAAVIAAVHDVETELESIGADTHAWGWTLTFLEGRPIVDLDDGTRILYEPLADRTVVVSPEADPPN